MKMFVLILLNRCSWNTLSLVTRKTRDHNMGRKAVPGPTVLLLAKESVSLVPMRFVLDIKGGVQSIKYFPLTLHSENRWL